MAEALQNIWISIVRNEGQQHAKAQGGRTYFALLLLGGSKTHHMLRARTHASAEGLFNIFL